MNPQVKGLTPGCGGRAWLALIGHDARSRRLSVLIVSPKCPDQRARMAAQEGGGLVRPTQSETKQDQTLANTDPVCYDSNSREMTPPLTPSDECTRRCSPCS